MYCFSYYMAISDLDSWIVKDNSNYTNKTIVLKRHDKNVKHQDVVRGCKAMLSKKSIITNSLIGPKVLGKRELEKRDQHEYTKKLIDCVAYCQTWGIVLRGLDELKVQELQEIF